MYIQIVLIKLNCLHIKLFSTKDESEEVFEDILWLNIKNTPMSMFHIKNFWILILLWVGISEYPTDAEIQYI